MIVGIPKETFPGERRVAIVPSVVPLLTKAGLDVLIEPEQGRGMGPIELRGMADVPQLAWTGGV